jgi:hypothetical protein
MNMSLKNPLSRHSGEGRNPANKNTLQSRQGHDDGPLRGRFLFIWIPAFAGMTEFFNLDDSK